MQSPLSRHVSGRYLPGPVLALWATPGGGRPDVEAFAQAVCGRWEDYAAWVEGILGAGASGGVIRSDPQHPGDGPAPYDDFMPGGHGPSLRTAGSAAREAGPAPADLSPRGPRVTGVARGSWSTGGRSTAGGDDATLSATAATPPRPSEDRVMSRRGRGRPAAGPGAARKVGAVAFDDPSRYDVRPKRAGYGGPSSPTRPTRVGGHGESLPSPHLELDPWREPPKTPGPASLPDAWSGFDISPLELPEDDRSRKTRLEKALEEWKERGF